MKIILVLLCCVLVLVSARPDVSLGYHYNPDYNSGSNLLAPPTPIASTSYFPTASGAPTTSSGSVNFLAPDYNVAAISSASAGSSSFANAASSAGIGFTSGNYVGGGSGYNTGGSISQGGASGFGGQSYTGGIDQGYIGSGGTGGTYQQYAQQYQEQAPIITKHFYVHSAPEDHDNQEIVRYITIGRPTTNYRVVFINAPSSTSTKAKIIAKVAPVQERTAIYLLSKKSNDLDISADVVTPAPTAANKPDVFFIKYNTPQEAIHAQHVIQAQYDKLGGSSDISNQGNIPVQSVIGSVGGQSNAASSSSSAAAQSSSQNTGYSIGQNQIQQQSGIIQPQANYLPPTSQSSSQTTGYSTGQNQLQPQPQTNYLPPTVYRRRRYYRY